MARTVSVAVASFGTVLRMEGTTPGTYDVRLGDVFDLEIPGWDTDIIDVTHMESPGAGALGAGTAWKEKLGSLLDAGQVAVTLRYVPNGSEIVALYAAAGQPGKFQIEFTEATSLTTASETTVLGSGARFSAIIKSFKPSKAAVNGVHEGVLTLDVTGPLTWDDDVSVP